MNEGGGAILRNRPDTTHIRLWLIGSNCNRLFTAVRNTKPVNRKFWGFEWNQ